MGETLKERHRRMQQEAMRRAEGVNPDYMGKSQSDAMGLNYFDPKAEKIFRECSESGEPMIIFRAKDVLSLMVIAHYQSLLEMYIPENFGFHERVAAKALEVRQWQALNPS